MSEKKIGHHQWAMLSDLAEYRDHPQDFTLPIQPHRLNIIDGLIRRELVAYRRLDDGRSVLVLTDEGERRLQKSSLDIKENV